MPYLNISFPFNISKAGYLFDNDVTSAAIVKSNLTHLLTTEKGNRLYHPAFGINLKKYLFETNDAITSSDIIQTLREGVRQFMPSVSITNLIATSSNQGRSITVEINYDVNEGLLVRNDTIFLEFNA
jgi:phage baseplate assembly protein W